MRHFSNTIIIVSFHHVYSLMCIRNVSFLFQVAYKKALSLHNKIGALLFAQNNHYHRFEKCFFSEWRQYLFTCKWKESRCFVSNCDIRTIFFILDLKNCFMIFMGKRSEKVHFRSFFSLKA